MSEDKVDLQLLTTLQWRHNERHGVSNHQPHDCLLKRLFMSFTRRSKKTLKLRVTGLCHGWKFTGDRWIPRTKSQKRGKCFHLMTSSWNSVTILSNPALLFIFKIVYCTFNLNYSDIVTVFQGYICIIITPCHADVRNQAQWLHMLGWNCH